MFLGRHRCHTMKKEVRNKEATRIFIVFGGLRICVAEREREEEGERKRVGQ